MVECQHFYARFSKYIAGIDRKRSELIIFKTFKLANLDTVLTHSAGP